MNLTRRLTHAALGVPFVWLGYQAASEPGARVEKAADLGLPEPEAMVRFNGAAMVVGGAALALGVLPRAAATGLILSLIPTTLAGHAFWKEDEPGAAKAQQIQLLKNLGLAGGLAAVAITDKG